MEFLNQMRSIPAEFRRTGARAVARAVICALVAEGGRSVSVRLDRQVESSADTENPIDDSYVIFEAGTGSKPGDRNGGGNTPSRILLRVLLVPAAGGDRERGPFLVVAQPVTQWEWIWGRQSGTPSLWVLSPEAVAAADNAMRPFATSTLTVSAPPYDVLAGDLSGPEKVVCDAFAVLRRQLREDILRQFSQSAQTIAPAKVPVDRNCDPGGAETVLVRRPPFPDDAHLYKR